MGESIIYKMGVDNGNSVEQINEINTALKGVDAQMTQTSTGAEKLAQTLEFGSAVAGGIAAVQGAMGLLGIENEKAMKTISRLMQLQAIAGGLQQGANLLLKENIVLTKIKTAVQWLYNAALKSAVLTTALLSGGFTLLIGGIGYLISSMGDSTKKTDENTRSIKQNAETIKAAANEYKEYNKILNENADAVERVDFVNGEIVKSQTEGLALLERDLMLMKAKGVSQLEIFKQEKRIIDERIRLNADAMLTETNHIEFLRREKDFEAQKQIIDIEMKKERDRIAFEQFQETETENAEKIKNLLINKNDSISEINNNAKLNELNSTKKANAELEKENKRYDKFLAGQSAKQRQRDYEDNQIRLQIASQTINGLVSLSEIFGKEGEKSANFQKQLAVFQIAIDTATAISQATAKGVTGDPLTTALRIASTTAVVLSNIAKAKQLLSGANAPSYNGGGSGQSSISTPSFYSGSITNPATGQLNRGDGGVTGQFVRSDSNTQGGRVFVVDTDITSIQEQTKFVEVVSTF